jgi:hypothetical protein
MKRSFLPPDAIIKCICEVVVHPEKAPTSYTRSPEPEIARRRFGFEFWLAVFLFLFLAGMTIAQRLF